MVQSAPATKTGNFNNLHLLGKKYLTSSSHYYYNRRRRAKRPIDLGKFAPYPKKRLDNYRRRTHTGASDTFVHRRRTTTGARAPKIFVKGLRRVSRCARDAACSTWNKGRQAALSWIMRHGAPLILPYGTRFFCAKHCARIAASMRASDSAVWSSIKP